ncbi:MAG: hypothetical protein ACLQG3_14850 [Terracidiphilus sp.]
MTTHPTLRAYLAGIFIPTLILPLFLIAFIVLRLVLQVPVPIERGIVFPMALVPILWGLWNMLWLGWRGWTRLSIGVHGALLPFLLLPAGATTASCLGVLSLGASGVTWFHALQVPYALIVPCFLAAVVAYYLVWKYIVGFINRTLDIA